MRKKIGGLLWILAVFFIASCGFEIPESLTVTGNPGIHLPLGSPFGAMGESINDYIGQEKIREMVGPNDPDNKVRLYDYQGDGTPELEVQTYVVRYEIAKLNLDLEKHIEEADDITVPSLVIPAIPAGSPGGVYLTSAPPFFTASEPSEPLFEIGLGTMEQWLKDVQLNGAGITIRGGAGLADTLRLKIPQLGIDKYEQGVSDEKGDLVFTGGAYTLLDKNDSKGESTAIQIYAHLVDTPKDGTYTMELNFKWDKATLHPGEKGEFTESYTVNFGELTGYLGNARLKEVPAYVFIAGLPDSTDGKMTLQIGEKQIVPNETISPASLPGSLIIDEEHSTVKGPIPDSSIKEKLDLVDLFTTDSGTLDYSITVSSVDITPQSPNPMLTVELLIMLPLDFEVTGDTVTVAGNYYKELELKPLKGLTDSTKSGDLFGRTGQEDDTLKDIHEVALKFYKYTNTLIEGVALFVGKPAEDSTLEKLLPLESSEPDPLTFTRDEVKYPFNPQFKILVEAQNGNTAFKIRPLAGKDVKLDFSLALEASADIEQTIDF
ncbi:MAG: hypothetical protein LBU25_07245 [Treponema sp.]|nr:hypothetical protein [Treponema sp.]